MAQLRHVALRCCDMQRSREFYEQGIGWEFIATRPSGRACDMTDGTNNITLIQQPADCDRPILEEGNEYMHIGVIVDDLDSCRERLAQLGAEFITEAIKQQTESERSFKVLDPDGNVVDVTVNHEEWLGVDLN